LANGGQGANGGAGGTGGDAGGTTAAAGNGGNGTNGGNGGKGGTITVTTPNQLGTVGGPSTSGGAGGAGGIAGQPGQLNGSTGSAGKPGKAGNPGAIGAAGTQKIGYEGDDEAHGPNSKKRKQQMIASADASAMKPVAFVQTTLQLSDRAVEANNVMLAPEREDLIAQTGSARIHVAKGAAAFVVNNGRDIAVLSLHDGGNGDVSVLIGGQEISLRAGEQVLITSSEEQWGDVNLLDGVTVRGGTERRMENGDRVYVSEFSIPSAIRTLPALSGMATSTDGHDRAVYNRIVKNAAVMQTLMIRKGTYAPLRKSSGGRIASSAI
jgi:hypothetical protein